jgi:hypothetical protein
MTKVVRILFSLWKFDRMGYDSGPAASTPRRPSPLSHIPIRPAHELLSSHKPNSVIYFHTKRHGAGEEATDFSFHFSRF